MKKIIIHICLILTLVFLTHCAGYKPIFGTTSTEFEIADYNIQGNKILGNKLYSKLQNLSKSKKNDESKRDIEILINLSQTKNSTSKDSSGKILGYKITIDAQIEVIDFATNQKILNRNFNSSLNYKVQDQYFDTIKLEQKIIEDLIEEIYQSLLINISKNINT